MLLCAASHSEASEVAKLVDQLLWLFSSNLNSESVFWTLVPTGRGDNTIQNNSVTERICKPHTYSIGRVETSYLQNVYFSEKNENNTGSCGSKVVIILCHKLSY